MADSVLAGSPSRPMQRRVNSSQARNCVAGVACRCTKTHCWQVLRAKGTDRERGAVQTRSACSGECQPGRPGAATADAAVAVPVAAGEALAAQYCEDGSFSARKSIQRSVKVHARLSARVTSTRFAMAGGFARFLVCLHSSVNRRLTGNLLAWKL